jgi:predicted HTH transcriptional regulator
MTSKNPEGYYFDRKEVRKDKGDLESIRKKIYKTVSAFTNSKGGVLVLSIDDKGNVIGLNELNEQERISLFKVCDDKLVNHYAVSKEFETTDEKKLLLIYAKEGRMGICETNNSQGEIEAYKREGASSLPLTKQDRERLIIERNTNFELLTVCDYDFSLMNKTVYDLFKRLDVEKLDIAYSTDDAKYWSL